MRTSLFQLLLNASQSISWKGLQSGTAPHQDARRLNREHAVWRFRRRRVAREHFRPGQVPRHGVEAGLPACYDQHLGAKAMKGFGQNAAETAAGTDKGDGNTG